MGPTTAFRCSICGINWPRAYASKPCPQCAEPLWPIDEDPIPLTQARKLERSHQYEEATRLWDEQITDKFVEDLKHIESELANFAKVDIAPDK